MIKLGSAAKGALIKGYLYKTAEEPEHYTLNDDTKAAKAPMENRQHEKESSESPSVYYHGSPTADIKKLRAGSYVTPWQEDAASFSVRWSSRDLEEGHRNQKGTNGRPPLKLRFKGEPPPDHPVYIYKILKDALRESSATNTGAEYDWNSKVTEDTPVELVRTIPSWQKEMLDDELMKQERVSRKSATPSNVREIKNVLEELRGRDDVLIRVYGDIPGKYLDKVSNMNRQAYTRGYLYKVSSDELIVYTAAPPGSDELIKKYGLLSAKSLIDNPEALAAVIENRRNSVHAMTSEEFVESVKTRMKERPWTRSQEGPSVFFGTPDPDKITDKHPSRQFKSDMYKVNLGKLLEDIPETVVQGTELIPYYENMSEEDIKKKRGPLTKDQIRSYLKTSPKELWKHYDEPEGKMYASNVPHGFVITPSGAIPGKYLDKVSNMNRQAYLQGYMSKEAAPSATQISAAIGAALGIGSGTLANFILSKMMGYEGDWMSYVASGAVGGLAGGFGGAAAGDAVKRRIDYYKANPGEAGDILLKIEQDPRLRKVGDALRKNPLMRPIRRALGRPFVSLKKPVGYDSSEIKKNFDKSVKDIGLRKTLAKVIKGEPLWNNTKFDSSNHKAETEKRMLAQRAYFDLPLDESKMSEHFEVDKQDPKTWRYKKDDLFHKKELDAKVRAKFHGYHPNPYYKHIPVEKKVQTKGDKEFIEDSASFIAGFRATRDKGSDIARVADRWDYENYRGGEGYKEEVPTTTQSMGGGGYSNVSVVDMLKGGILGKNRSREIERNKHLVKNILDILLGNPITLKQDIDLSKKALPKAVQERM